MAQSEDNTNGGTVARAETRAKSYKIQSRTSAGWGGRGDRGNARNNTRDSSTSTRKDYKGEIEAFGAVLALKHENVDIKKPFDVFREKLINSIIN